MFEEESYTIEKEKTRKLKSDSLAIALVKRGCLMFHHLADKNLKSSITFLFIVLVNSIFSTGLIIYSLSLLNSMYICNFMILIFVTRALLNTTHDAEWAILAK